MCFVIERKYKGRVTTNIFELKINEKTYLRGKLLKFQNWNRSITLVKKMSRTNDIQVENYKFIS